MMQPGPRPLAGQEIDGAPRVANDVSRPCSDRGCCLCRLGSGLIVGRSHLYLNCLNYLLYSKGVQL